MTKQKRKNNRSTRGFRQVHLGFVLMMVSILLYNLQFMPTAGGTDITVRGMTIVSVPFTINLLLGTLSTLGFQAVEFLAIGVVLHGLGQALPFSAKWRKRIQTVCGIMLFTGAFYLVSAIGYRWTIIPLLTPFNFLFHSRITAWIEFVGLLLIPLFVLVALVAETSGKMEQFYEYEFEGNIPDAIKKRLQAGDAQDEEARYLEPTAKFQHQDTPQE